MNRGFNESDFTGENLFLVAARHYRSQFIDFEELNKDLRRGAQIRSLMSRRLNQIKKKMPIKDKIHRILLNQIIIFFNVFSIDFAKSYLFFLIDEKNFSTLKTVLIFLSYMEEDEMIEISLDPIMINFLRTRI
jgi:hypothetical protein